MRPTHASFPFLIGPFTVPSTQTFPQVKKEKFQEGNMVKSRNEPCLLHQILSVICNIKEIEPGMAAGIIYESTIQMFPLLSDSLDPRFEEADMLPTLTK